VRCRHFDTTGDRESMDTALDIVDELIAES
jgi:hypothetical protein